MSQLLTPERPCCGCGAHGVPEAYSDYPLCEACCRRVDEEGIWKVVPSSSLPHWHCRACGLLRPTDWYDYGPWGTWGYCSECTRYGGF